MLTNNLHNQLLLPNLSNYVPNYKNNKCLLHNYTTNYLYYLSTYLNNNITT